MDQVAMAAVKQGFAVRQTVPKGAWIFQKGNVTLTFRQTPRTSRDWVVLINTLRGAGLRFPEEE